MEEVKKYITTFEFEIKITPLKVSKDGNFKDEYTLVLKAPNGSHTELVDDFLSSTKQNTIMKKMIASGLCTTKKDNITVNETMLDDLDIRDTINLVNKFIEVFFSI